MPQPLLIDTHAHINFKDYRLDGDEVIRRALDQGIWLINVGAQYSTSRRAVEYAQKYPQGVYAAVGLHPSHLCPHTKQKVIWQRGKSEEEFEEFETKKYQAFMEKPKVVAVGEVGLDYYEEITTSEKEKQKEVLIKQLELAQQAGKPVIFHCRKAYNDLIEILAMFNLGCAHCPMSCAPRLRGVIHSFMGRWSQAKKLLEMGFYFGFNGLITYARDYDKVIKNLPLEMILLETDSPYLTPVPHRYERNEPSYVRYVAEKIAHIKGISFEKVAEQTTKNAQILFNLEGEQKEKDD